MPNLPRPIRQLAAVALLIAALAMLWFLGVAPLSAHFERLGEEIDNARSTLGRFAAVAALQDRLAETQQAGRAASGAIPGLVAIPALIELPLSFLPYRCAPAWVG